jgi:hypothetical protein
VLGELVLAVEDMKTLLAQAQQTRAFTHFNDFAQATEITVSPGSQWRWLARTLPGHLPLVQVGRCWLVRGACTWVSTPSPLVGEGRGGGAAARAVCAAPVSTPPSPPAPLPRGERGACRQGRAAARPERMHCQAAGSPAATAPRPARPGHGPCGDGAGGPLPHGLQAPRAVCLLGAARTPNAIQNAL